MTDLKTTSRTTQLTASLLLTHITLAILVISFLIEFFQNNYQHWISFAVQVLPLIGFGIAFRKENPKAYAWFCFLLLIYFIFLMPLLNGKNTWLDWLQVSCTCVCFISAMMTVRWLKTEIKAAAPSI